jgi:hypothetical protein
VIDARQDVVVNKYDELVQRFIGGQPIHQMAARMILLAVQEEAVEALADSYYAGLNEAQAKQVLGILGEIGGYESLNILRDVFQYEPKLSLKLSAAEGLIRNAEVLSLDEKLALKDFLESLT